MAAEAFEMAQTLYSGIVDEPEVSAGWDKQTIKFIIANEKLVRDRIRTIGASMRRGKISNTAVDDIFCDVQDYFYKYHDYEVRYSEDGKAIPLLGYICSGIRNCIKRYFAMLQESGEVSFDMELGEEGGFTLGDIVPDKNSEEALSNVEIDLRTALVGLSTNRMFMGKDVFIPLYVGIRLWGDTETQKAVLEILGYTKEYSDRLMVEAKVAGSPLNIAMEALAYEIGQGNDEEAIEMLGRYVPNVSTLNEVSESKPSRKNAAAGSMLEADEQIAS